MDNKYYTPTIEEFHAGFEFELQEYTHEEPTGGWTEAMFGKLLIHNEGGMLSTDLKDVVRWIKNEDVRVKYLDREDVESLGWEHKQFVTESQTVLNYKLNSTTLNHWMQSPFTCGYYIEIWDDESDKEFNGYIKNKSELKKLMQQLNII